MLHTLRPMVMRSFYEFDEGIVCQGPEGVAHAYPWKMASQVYLSSTRHFINRAYIHTTYSFTLVLVNGDSLSQEGTFEDPQLWRGGLLLNKTTDGGDGYALFTIFSAASQAISMALLPDSVGRLERGEELPFGDITISLAGVRAGNRLVSWGEITGFEVKDGVLRVRHADALRSLFHQQVGKVPNLQLLFMLVDAIRRDQSHLNRPISRRPRSGPPMPRDS